MGGAGYYFALSSSDDAHALFTQRVGWACVFCFVLCVATGSLGDLRKCYADRTRALAGLCAALVIASNWYVVIWSAKHGQMTEVSLGFYLAPMLTVLLGIAVLGETLTWWSLLALGLTALGVALVFVANGRGLALNALYIAASSAVYALLRKRQPVPPIAGNMFETAVAALCVLVYAAASGTPLPSLLGCGSDSALYAMGLGVVTTLPMLFYVYSLDKVSLALNGYLQYLSPTVLFLLAWFLLHEPVPAAKLVGFGCVWVAIALYAVGRQWPRAHSMRVEGQAP